MCSLFTKGKHAPTGYTEPQNETKHLEARAEQEAEVKSHNATKSYRSMQKLAET